MNIHTNNEFMVGENTFEKYGVHLFTPIQW